MLNTKVEHDFIRGSQRGLTNAEDYFITGSVFPEKTGTFYYGLRPRDLVSVMPPGYSPIQSGNMVENLSAITVTVANCVAKYISNK